MSRNGKAKWIVQDVDGKIVVMPIDDIKAHEPLNTSCKCGSYVTDEGVIVHNAFDNRQIFEKAEDGIPQIL